MQQLTERHQSTQDIARYFEYRHLGDRRLMEISKMCHDLADSIISELPDSPELTVGLRKLLEAKDCFVRSALPPA